MSAFLGPIHHWLYHKIMVQESLVQAILQYNEDKQYIVNLQSQTDQQCGVIEQKPLEEIIDGDNIHGWLQERIHVVETRLSFVVTSLVKEDAARMHDILNIAYEKGLEEFRAQKKDKESIHAVTIFQMLNDMLLDGMPCDHINVQVSQSEDEVVYRQTRCIHEEFWMEQGGLVMNYYDIRKKMIEGFLSETSFEFVIDEENNYHIRRIA